MTHPGELAGEIAAALRGAGTTERAVKEKAYLKSDLEHWGTRVPDTRSIVREALRHRDPLDRDGAVRLAEELWAEPVHERRTAAVEVLTFGRRQLAAADLTLVERLVREARTWALVDGLAVHVAGDVVGRDPAGTAATLDAWAGDPDLWVRRSALLALLPGLRRGGGDFARFGRYADAMLDETEFFIRKAIGWVLREASKQAPERVAAWLAPRTHRASGVTMREAVKYLPAGQTEELMAAYREKRPA